MSEDHFGILQDAPKTESVTCCKGIFNKPQLLYMLLFWTCGLVVIASVCVVPYAAYKILPPPKSSGEAGLLAFSETRARIHLDFLVNNIGPRPFGSPQNTLAAQYILSQIERINNETGHPLVFGMDMNPGGAVDRGVLNLWNRMQNIYVMVKGDGTRPDAKALLVSAHYDTVTMSAGATDNTMAVSCLLELIEVLAHQQAGKRPVIFAFVNGEETGLLGARHTTATSWFGTKVGAFINVDGTPGGKSMLFRSTGGAMDFAYEQVPHPLGFVVAQDIFDLGIIDSDTDFSVYKTDKQGLDWATFSHRQTYHTLKDIYVARGAPQFLGDNLLSIVRYVIDSKTDIPEVPDVTKLDRHVYFSFLSSGFAIYSKAAALGMHITITILLILVMIFLIVHRALRWKDAFQFSAAPPVRILGFGFLIALSSFVASIGTGAIMSFIALKLGPWFVWSNPAMGTWAFVFPCLAAFLLVQWITVLVERRFRIVVEVSRLQLLWGHAAVVILLLLITLFATIKKLGSTYLIYLTAAPIIGQLMLQHFGYLMGYMSDDKSEYIPLANEERMSLLTSNTLGYGVSHNIVNEERHQASHRPKVDSKTTHLMWFLIFLIGALSLIFLTDILPVLFEFASGGLTAMIFGPVVGIVVYMFAINLMPLVRRGGHLGVVTLIVFIAAVSIFFSLVAINRNHFDNKYPYVMRPHSSNGKLSLEAIHQFQPSVFSQLQHMSEVTRNTYGKVGAYSFIDCTKWVCSSVPRPLTAPTPTINKLGATLLNTQYTFNLTAANAQYHSFNLPDTLYANFTLVHKGLQTTWTNVDLRDRDGAKKSFSSVFLMLIDPTTEPFSFGYSGGVTGAAHTWTPGWTDPNALYGFTELLSFLKSKDALQGITFMGTGHALHATDIPYNQ